MKSRGEQVRAPIEALHPPFAVATSAPFRDAHLVPIPRRAFDLPRHEAIRNNETLSKKSASLYQAARPVRAIFGPSGAEFPEAVEFSLGEFKGFHGGRLHMN